MEKQKPSNLNLPNALTLLRLLLIPVFLYLMHIDQMMPALGVFLFASLTDLVDGWIARHYHLVTDLGKLFDPLADKLMVLSVVVMLTVKGIIPLAAIIILLVKEGLMLLGGWLLLRKKIVVYALPLGKIGQVVLVAALVLCFFHYHFTAWGYPVHLWLLWTGVGFAIISLLHYARRNGPKLFTQTAQTQKGEE